MPAEGIGGLAEGVTPLEMADAYATLANGGIHHDPTAISKVEFPNGKVDESGADDGERVLTEGQAYEVTRILEGVITPGTGAGYTSIGCSSEAGKTGTSEEESDAWFVGYTPMFSTAVWVGHPQSREYTGFGGPTAGPIWQSFMSAAQEGECPEFEVPDSLPELSEPDSEQHLLVRLLERLRRRRNYGDEEEENEDEAKRAAKRKKLGARKGAGRNANSGTHPDADSKSNPQRPTLGRRHQPRLVAVLDQQLQLLSRNRRQVERFPPLVGDLDHLHLAEVVHNGAARSDGPPVNRVKQLNNVDLSDGLLYGCHAHSNLGLGERGCPGAARRF